MGDCCIMMKSHKEEIVPHFEEGMKLAKELGASACSMSFSHSKSISIAYESNRLKESGAAEKSSYGISLVIDGREGTSVGNVPEAFSDMVRRAAEFAKHGAVSHFDTYPEPAKEYRKIKKYSGSVFELTLPKLKDDCQYLVDKMLEADAELITEAGGSVTESESYYLNSAGFVYDEKTTGWDLSAGYQKTTGTDMLFSGGGRSSCKIDEFYDKEQVLEDPMFDLEHSRNIVKVESGTVPLFIPPSLVKKFLSPVVMGINGRNVFKGTSPLKDKLGTKCFSTNLSLLDDPHLDFIQNSTSADSAGIPTQKHTLVDNGVLKTFLYDYDTAKMAGAEPTGNDGCSPYNLMVAPGNESESEMIASIKHGIYVKQMLGFGQTNLMNGDFSANLALAFLIENGEIVGRVKDAMIGGNILELLAGDVRFGSTVHPYYMKPCMVLPGVELRA